MEPTCMNARQASLRLDVGVLDHLAPLAELNFYEVAKLALCAGKTLEADVAEFRLGVRAVDDLAQRGVELRHDFRWRTGRRDQASPGIEFEALDAGFVHGRQIGE